MLDEYLAKVKQRSDAATPNWEFWSHAGKPIKQRRSVFYGLSPPADVYPPSCCGVKVNGGSSGSGTDCLTKHEDFEFAAHARTDVPKLLRIIARLRKAGVYDGAGLTADLTKIVSEL